MRRLTALLAVAVCAAVALAAYFALQQTQPVKLRIGVQPSWHHIAFYIMWDKGWIQKVLKVEPELYSFESGPLEMQAFAAGHLDIAYVGATPPMSILAQGVKAKLVAVANTEGSSLVVRPDISYTDPQSLKGKRISCYPPGSIQDTILKKWLREHGIDPEKDVYIIHQRGPAEQHPSLKSGEIDAAFFPDPHPYLAVLGGYGKIALSSRDMWPRHPCCVVLMSEELIAKHRDLAVKFVALHIIASQYAIDPKNKGDVVRILMKYLKIDERTAEAFPGTTNINPDPTDRLWLDGVDEMCETLYELGVTRDARGNPVRLSASDIVDTTLYQEALNMVPQIRAELGLG